MIKAHWICRAEPEAAIDKLLACAEPISIVDGLFELADDGACQSSDDWNRAVSQRLQVKLAERMKQVISNRSN